MREGGRGNESFSPRRGLNVPPATEKRVSIVLPLSAGCYRIGHGVCTVGSKGGFTIIDGGDHGDHGDQLDRDGADYGVNRGGTYGFNMGGTYTVARSGSKGGQWVRVLPCAVKRSKVLELRVTYLEGASSRGLLVRDMEKESAIDASSGAPGTDSVEQMRIGVSLQAQAARVTGAYEPGGAA